MLASIGAAFAVSVVTWLTARGGGLQARTYFAAIMRRLFRYASPYAIISFLLQFNNGDVPGNVTTAFIRAAGGGTRAIVASRALASSMGGYNVIMLLLGAIIYALGVFGADTRQNTLAELERKVADLRLSLTRNPERPPREKARTRQQAQPPTLGDPNTA